MLPACLHSHILQQSGLTTVKPPLGKGTSERLMAGTGPSELEEFAKEALCAWPWVTFLD